MSHYQQYIYQRQGWPEFRWDVKKVSKLLLEVRYSQGRLLGSMEALGFQFREEATLNNLTLEVIKSSEIEGDQLEADQVRSSVAKKLGLDISGLPQADRHVEGVVEMMYNATDRYDSTLTKARLFKWQRLLFPGGYSGFDRIKTGQWRDDSAGPMQVVSGPVGCEKVHYEAPPADRVDQEMARFLAWYNDEQDLDLVLKAGVAHLWFVTIHPFADGNGRISRAITDMTLGRSEGTRQRYYSMSSQIREDRNKYYEALERTQKGDLDITNWLLWFLDCLQKSIKNSKETLSKVMKKARFWEQIAATPLNERQVKIINLMLEDFEGKLTTSKWAKINKCSQDTAYRDILDLIHKKVFIKNPGEGRSTSYSLIAG